MLTRNELLQRISELVNPVAVPYVIDERTRNNLLELAINVSGGSVPIPSGITRNELLRLLLDVISPTPIPPNWFDPEAWDDSENWTD